MSHGPGGYLHRVFSILGLRRRAGTAGAGAQPAAEDATRPPEMPDAGGAPVKDAAGADRQARDRLAFETGLQQFRTLRGMAGYVAGRVHVLNTDLVRQRLGKRWPRLEHRIHEIIKGELKRRLSSHDLFTRVDDNTYVLVFGDCSELEAQVKIALLSERLLEKLLGEEEARHLEAMGVQRLIMQADGVVAREALQSTDALMALLDRAQAAGLQPGAYHGSDAAAGKRALVPPEIAHLVGKLDRILDEIGGGESADAVSVPDGPLVKFDRLRRLVRQLEQLEAAMGADNQGAGPAAAAPGLGAQGQGAQGQGAQEQAALRWLQDLKSKAERQLVFLHDRDPRSGGSGGTHDEAVQLDFSYQPMWHAPSKKVGIYLCQAAVVDADGNALLPQAAPGDDGRDAVAVADRLMLRRVLDDIRTGMAEKAPIIVAAPVHFSSLQPERSRIRLLELCRDLPEAQRGMLLWEIVGAHVESWSFQLPDILQQMKRIAPAVFLRLDGVENHFADIRRAFRHLRQAGVHAVGLDVGTLHGGEAEKLGLLEKLARGAGESGLKCYGHGFDSLSLTAGAVGLGYQHVSGPAITAPLPRPAGIQTAALEALHERLMQKQAAGGPE